MPAKQGVSMKFNVGGLDRMLRIALGLVLIVLAAMGIIGWWGWLGVIPLVPACCASARCICRWA